MPCKEALKLIKDIIIIARTPIIITFSQDSSRVFISLASGRKEKEALFKPNTNNIIDLFKIRNNY